MPIWGLTLYNLMTQRITDLSLGGRKVNNALGVNWRRNVAFACTPSLSPRVITWTDPAIRSIRKPTLGRWSSIDNTRPFYFTHKAYNSTILSSVTRERTRRKMKPANIKLDHSSVIYLYSCPLSTDEISFISRGHSALVTTTYMYQLAVSAMRLAEYFFWQKQQYPQSKRTRHSFTHKK